MNSIKLLNLHPIIFNSSYFHQLNVSHVVCVVIELSIIFVIFLFLFFFRCVVLVAVFAITRARGVVHFLSATVTSNVVFSGADLTVDVDGLQLWTGVSWLGTVIFVVISIFLILNDILDLLSVHSYFSSVDLFLLFLHLLINFAVNQVVLLFTVLQELVLILVCSTFDSGSFQLDVFGGDLFQLTSIKLTLQLGCFNLSLISNHIFFFYRRNQETNYN